MNQSTQTFYFLVLRALLMLLIKHCSEYPEFARWHQLMLAFEKAKLRGEPKSSFDYP
jgi:hypothetical protein